jgi:hypothetical protein
MVRVRPTAAVSSWLLSVAEVLPLPHRAVAPYTLAEAAAELGAYAQAVDALTWTQRAGKNNRKSLRIEIDAQSKSVGRRIDALVGGLLDELRDDADQEAVVSAAARFKKVWHSEVAVTDAFRDLCDAAKVAGTTSRELRKLSAVIASQVGPAASSTFSLLRHAADALVNTEEDLAPSHGMEQSGPLTEARRLEMASEILVAPPTGRVVVWTAYHRAALSRMREVAGPMTFLRADCVLPNPSDIAVSDFPELSELREIHREVYWLDELHVEALKPENRLALVRVDLGERQLAGAAEEARRRIEAVLSIPVEAGGISWQNAGASAVLLDGKVRDTSHGLMISGATALPEDSYGMGATADILSSVAEQLDEALTKGPMPEHLVEALSSLREARMTDHRDVDFFGARRVTPRIATALEDHAMELFSSVLRVRSDKLAETIQLQEALAQAGRRTAKQLRAPFDGAWAREHHPGRKELEQEISDYGRGGGVLVSVSKAAAHHDELRALPMSDLQRADLEDALKICTDPVHEREFLEEMQDETKLLRDRHRRVRNAVNHGLPLSETTLNSVRDYADETSRSALNIALTWFKKGADGPALLQKRDKQWADRLERIAQGMSWAEEEDSRRSQESKPA